MLIYLNIGVCQADNVYSFYTESPFAQKYFVIISNISDRFASGVLDDSDYSIVYSGNYKECNDRYVLKVKTVSFKDTSLTLTSRQDSIVLLKHPKKNNVLWLVEMNGNFVEYNKTLYLQSNNSDFHEKEYYKIDKVKSSRAVNRIVRKVELDLERDKQEFIKYQDRFKP